MSIETVVDLEPGVWYYRINIGPFGVVENNASFDHEAGEANGTLQIDNNGDLDELDAKEIQEDIDSQDIIEVSSGVREEAGEILQEFAHQQVTELVRTLGHTHEFNGMDDVQQVADLLAASEMVRADNDSL